MKLSVEFLLLIVIGACFAFLGNLISPVGLNLTKDYFPPALPAEPVDSKDPVAEVVASREPKHEFGSVTMDELQEMLSSPKFTEGSYMLLDARDDAHYDQEHIVGAIQFYHFRPERTLEQVVMGGHKAERIVIYCNGGSCEDSHYAARLLVDLGVPRGIIFIYNGGIKEWKAAGLSLKSR